ncbi:MAG: 50S ribosomal protein L5 [Planctomycetaceae bacterium]|nr:50S ribosomal protein L5 [Planctomycetaceae bacterium]
MKSARLLEKYRKEVLPAMQKDYGRSNPHSLPRLEKICLNMGIGKAIDDSKILEEGVKIMSTIAGQAAVVTKARVSVSNFRLRQGYKIGCRVTLRSSTMWEFFDRLVATAIPRIRDFRGVSRKSFDKLGNYSLGIEEVTIFPEVDADRLVYPFGMDVTFVIKNSKGREESMKFLKMMGMPFAE